MELIQKSGRQIHQPALDEQSELLYFVPLDFSAASYHALHYAVELAKESGGAIHLYHVADIQEVADSDNPIVIKRSLDRLEKRAATKLDSLREIIHEAGVQRVSSQVELGNVKSSMYKHILSVHPDIVVIGKKNDSPKSGSLANYLMRYSAAPLLFVPAPFNGKVFSSRQSLLVSNVDDQQGRPVRRYLHLAQKTGQKLSVMNAGSEEVLKVIQDNLEHSSVDLVCAVRKKNPFWKRIFSRDRTLALLRNINTPILLINEHKQANR